MTLQGPNKDFALHTVGWQAFQDLATTIVEVDFGRQVHRVAPVKDQGRDGFFYGVPDEAVIPGDKRETTIQAKHFVVPTKTLTVGDLGSELASVRELAKTGRAHGYILVTNASVTEANRLKITAALTEVGVERAYVLGRQWVTSKILEHPKVRALAPRVYGLGDLSWIRSDVARRQALAILDTMGEGLRRYVPTAAHRAAVEALAKHRFVLLLGDPAVGKSSIAAALSVAATDEDHCDVIFVRNPGEFLRNWDPEIENRLFWVDDAFGTTKLESALMDPWNKILSSMQAAIKRGNRFILTSRSHIWKQASRDLKQGAFPPLSHGHVVVDVEALTDPERKRILYNHLRFGTQPKGFNLQIKPFLEDVLAAGNFRPEIARRLSDPAYTGGLKPTLEGLKDFFARPEAFLIDTLTNLPDPMQAAIGLIFINGGRLSSPIEADEAQRLISELYAATSADIRNGLQALDGSFVLKVAERDECFWTYKHPTIGDAYARMVRQDQDLVTLYVRGSKLSQLLDEATCGITVRGGVRIPSSLYDLLLDRFSKNPVNLDAVRKFLLFRSGPEFLRKFLDRFPKVVTQASFTNRTIASDVSAQLIMKADQNKALPDEARKRLLAELRSQIINYADVSFLTDDPSFERFLSSDERAELIALAREDIGNRFDSIIESERDNYEQSWDPSDWFEDLKSQIMDHRALFPEDEEVCQAVDHALWQIGQAIESIEEDREPEPDWDYERPGNYGAAPSSGARSIFDDLV
jgi:energy-coupling factor transporter ATP-binding protein EcfA2